ncbi:nicotinamide mononucleotide transporter [Ochrobactrum phage vB_OspM_OC]|nr:nicotinamide mononucleotide transporter [Ochrobactrum phage vB_OspM_OC]
MINKRSLMVLLESLALAVLLTGFSIVFAQNMGWMTAINWWEVAATFTSFSCTYMCVKQTRWNYPMAVLSTALLSYVFWKSGLYASMMLNLYLIPTVIYGYFIWGKDSETKPVQHVKGKSLYQYMFFTALAYLGALLINSYFGGSFAVLDSLGMIGTILAQFLLDRKKIETWFVWIGVNVVSVYVNFETGNYLIAIQFFLFLLNAVYGYSQWRKHLAYS